MEEVKDLMKQANSLVLSCKLNLGSEYFLERMWEYLGLVRVYTKKVIYVTIFILNNFNIDLFKVIFNYIERNATRFRRTDCFKKE